MKLTKCNLYGVKSVIVGLALIVGQAFSAVISIAPVTQNVDIGSLFSVDILITELASDVDISTFDLELAYDKNIIEFSDYMLSDNLGSLTSGEAMDISEPELPGILNIASISFLENLDFQSASFKLATVTFKGIASGISDLTLNVKDLGDFYANPLSASVQNGSVNVPEPSTVMLVSSGLVLLSLVSLRKKVLIQ
jgi:hypothetical protein